MKKNLSLFALCFLTHFLFSQESNSFLTESTKVAYLENLNELNGLQKKWQMDFAKYAAMNNNQYISDFRIISRIDSRLMNYPSQDFTDQNRLLLGNYSTQSLKIGNLKMNTIYLFDVTGRMVDYQTEFSLWKSRK